MARKFTYIVPAVMIFLYILIATLICYLGAMTAGAASFVLITLGGCFYLICRVKEPVLKGSLLFALFLRISLALVQVYTGIDLPGAGKDAVQFELLAWAYAETWLSGESIIVDVSVYYFSAMIAVLYSIFGRFEMLPSLVNIYLSLATIFLIFKLTVRVSSSVKAGGVAAVIMALLPTHNFYAAILLRETMMIFLLTLAFYCLVLWIEEGKPWQMLFSFLALAGNGVMHGHLFVMVWVNLVLLIIYNPLEKRFRISSRQVLYFILLLGFSSFLVGSFINYQLVFPGYPMTIIFDVDFIRMAIEGKYTNVSRTLYLIEMLPYSYFDLFWQTPVRVLYFLMAPFPWLIGNVADLFFFSDVLIYAAIMFISYFGFKLLIQKKRHLIIVVTLSLTVTILFLHAWGTVSYGTAWRHRQKLAPYLVPVASVAIASMGICKRSRLWGEEGDTDC